MPLSTPHTQKNIYVVLGTARSGTSAIARGLKALGVDLGSEFVPASQRVNPKGFWEDKEIAFEINREIYFKLDELPRGFAMIDKERLTGEGLQAIRNSAVKLITRRFESTESWGFKDPKSARLIPFWQSVFSSLGINENYVVVLRNPLSSAHSHQRLSNASAALETGLIRWLMDMIPCIQETSGKNRVIVSYEALMENPRKQLDRMRNVLGIPENSDTGAVDRFIDEFIDLDLYRNQFSNEDLKNHPAVRVAPLCPRAYELLQKVAHDELCFSDPDFVSGWEEILTLLDRGYPHIRYADLLLKDCQNYQRQLKAIQRSNLWKIIYPLRLVDDGIRRLKGKLKNKTS